MAFDLGLGSVIELPNDEAKRRWEHTTPQWPIVSATLDRISRDAFMARHRANHVNIGYADSNESAVKALAVKAAMSQAFGLQVNVFH